MRLDGRTILVTGGASGLGAAVVDAIVAADGRALILDLNEQTGQATAARHGAQARFVRADVTSDADVQKAVAVAVNDLGGLHGVVNAAGIANTDWADQVSLADWTRVLAVNLTGSFIVCRACLPHLRSSGGGTIVNFASGQGLTPFKQRSAYAASKAGVISLTRSLAMEWAPQVRVNTVCPGAVDTPMVRGGYSPEVLREQVGPRYALGRIGEPHEIALAALYLSSAESSFVTGIVLAVDGGRSYH